MSKKGQASIYEKFLDTVAQSGEHFSEYMVLVKTPSGTLDWRASDKTWAMGAARRYLSICKVEDEMMTRRSIE